MKIEHRGEIIFIDGEDLSLFKKYKWTIQDSHRGSGCKYLRHNNFLFHRVILGIELKSVEVDHINGNGLDNRRCNLRIATRAENSCNQKPNPKRTWGGRLKTSQYKGVYWEKAKKLWRSCITAHGKTIKLGHFVSEKAAASAYNDAALKYFGEFASINKLEG